ncbi:hypothetical protein KY343_01790 [Candidatus Woesearchaeota archaeon]|nr:hypothetical protein [Candidatus Woesearchaeota archaeon]
MKKTKEEFKSICELKEKFFPKDKECKKSFDGYEDMGIELSQNTLDKIRIDISKI